MRTPLNGVLGMAGLLTETRSTPTRKPTSTPCSRAASTC
ncbi:MAG: hypothetical protein WDN45_11290 [Caulobacteraceae bacterium]